MRNEARLRRRTALAVIIVVLGLVASSAPAMAASDKQIARAAALRRSDFGPGWTTKKHVEDPPTELAVCEGTNRASATANKYEFQSPDFVHGDEKVTNSVYVFPTVKRAKAYLAAFQDPAALDCLRQGLEEAAGGDPGVSTEIGELDVTGGPADDGVGFRADLRATAGDGSSATFVFEAVAFRVGRGVTGITTQSPDVAFADTADLARTSIKRLKQQLK